MTMTMMMIMMVTNKQNSVRVQEEEAELREAVKEADTDEVVMLKEKRQSMCLQLLNLIKPGCNFTNNHCP